MDPAIAKELAALREEIESLRADARGGQKAEGAAVRRRGGEQAEGVWTDEVKELIAAMQGAVETAENSVAVHPIAGVAAAFVAGLLIGRLTKHG